MLEEKLHRRRPRLAVATNDVATDVHDPPRCHAQTIAPKPFTPRKAVEAWSKRWLALGMSPSEFDQEIAAVCPRLVSTNLPACRYETVS
jgi:hypothetical protein